MHDWPTDARRSAWRRLHRNESTARPTTTLDPARVEEFAGRLVEHLHRRHGDPDDRSRVPDRACSTPSPPTGGDKRGARSAPGLSERYVRSVSARWSPARSSSTTRDPDLHSCLPSTPSVSPAARPLDLAPISQIADCWPARRSGRPGAHARAAASRTRVPAGVHKSDGRHVTRLVRQHLLTAIVPLTGDSPGGLPRASGWPTSAAAPVTP